jgi:hypothetical protein
MRRKSVSWGATFAGILALAFPPLLVLLADNKDLEPWVQAYVAGAVGGLVFELLTSAWGVELPSSPLRGPSVKEFAPWGRWIDIGFFGRMFTGAVAAPVFLIIINELEGTNNLKGLGNDLDTLAWAVLIGATSPTVWEAGRGLVQARFTRAQNALAKQELPDVKKQLDNIQKQFPKVMEDVAADRPGDTDVVTSMNAQLNRAIGRLETAERVLGVDVPPDERAGEKQANDQVK